MAKEFGFIVFGRGRRTWSRLPARSALLLRRGLHRRPAPLDTLRVPRPRAVYTQLKRKRPPTGDRFFLAGAEGHACFTGCVLGGRCFATAPASDFGAKNNSPNCFLYAPHPLGLQVLLLLYFSKTKNHPCSDGFVLAGAEGLEPSARGFGDRCSTN